MKKIIINQSLDCLEGLVGIAGGCEDEQSYSGLYVDDVEGINILNAAAIADSEIGTGKNLLERALKTAQRRTVSDFLSQMSKAPSLLQFKSIIEDNSVRMAGNDTWYGADGEWVSIYLEKYDTRKFELLSLFNFGFISNGASECVEICIEDDRTIREEQINVRVGYNPIPMLINSNSQFVRISIKVDGFQIGKKKDYLVFGAGCLKTCDVYSSKCIVMTCQTSADKVSWIDVTDYFGFDIVAQCKCDPNALACIFADQLALPIQLYAAASVLIEGMTTDRINHVKENGNEIIEKQLLRLVGGLDMTTGIKHDSDYWRSLQSAVDVARASIGSLSDIRCISCYSSKSVGDSNFASRKIRK